MSERSASYKNLVHVKVVLFMRGPLNAKCYLLYLSEGE